MIYLPEASTNEKSGVHVSAEQQGVEFYKWKLFPVIIATVYAFFLTSLPIDAFLDRINYFIYARSSYFIQSFYINSYISYLSNEPLWLSMNVQLYRIFDEETIVRAFIFLPAFVTAFLISSKGRLNLLFLFLLLAVPGVIQNYIVHIRQGVALSVFLLGYFSQQREIRYSLILLSPFIHSAFFAISAIFFVQEIFQKFDRVNFWKRAAALIAAGAGLLLFLELFVSSATLQMLTQSFRQLDEYRNINSEISGAGFVLWMMILLLLVSDGLNFVEENLFSIMSLLFYLSIYFVVPFAGRIIECVIVPIFFAGMMLSKWKKWAFVGLIFVQTATFYVLNAGSNWFGWGA